MCTFFGHLNVTKRSQPLSFWHFWLGNVLRTTTACIFSTSQLPKVVRTCGALCILTWKCASRHNGVQFFISYLARWLRTRRFSEPIFRPSGATNHWKNTVNRDFPTFSCACIFFLLSLSLLWSSHFFSSPPWLFTPLLFHLSIVSEVWLLNFLRTWLIACLPYAQSNLSISKFTTVYSFHESRCVYRFWCQMALSENRVPPIPMELSWLSILNKLCDGYSGRYSHVFPRFRQQHMDPIYGSAKTPSSSTPTADPGARRCHPPRCDREPTPRCQGARNPWRHRHFLRFQGDHRQFSKWSNSEPT